MLELCFGNAPGVSFRVKVPELLDKTSPEPNVVTGRVETWDRAVVLTGVDKSYRYFELEPADVDNEIEVRGFFVRGRFQIVRRENNSRRANEAWRGGNAKS